MAIAAHDPLELHRGVRELVALSTLPAAWRSTPAARIPDSLADILLRSLGAGFVFVRVTPSTDGGAIEALRQHGDSDGTMRLAVQRIGADGGIGLLVAGSERPEFPTEMDRLLLEVAANQAAVVLQQRRADEALQQSEERLRVALRAAETATRLKDEFIATISNELRWTAAIVEHSDDAIIGKTLDGIVTSWSPGAEKLYGYSADEMIGRHISTTAPPERWQEQEYHLERIKGGELVYRYDTERITKAGRRVDVSLTVSPIRDASGTLIGASIIARDISELKRAERKLRALFEAAPDATVLAEPSGRIVMVNAQVEHLLGYRREELLGRRVEVLVPQGQRAAHVAHRGQYLEEARPRPMGAGLELTALHKDGTEVPVEISLSPIDGDEGTVVIATLRDVSERRRRERQLRDAETRLAHMSRVATMGELATSIAHEVNQPLAAIVNDGAACLRWLQGNPPALDEARASVQYMIADANRASHVVARIRALLARQPAAKAPFDAADLVRETAALVKVQAARLGVAVHTEVAADLPYVLGDRIQVQQVLLNLMLNGIDAMRGVDDRPRELAVAVTRGETSTVLVAIRDSGIGIPPELRDRIFEPFYTTKSDGLGMGLAISRSIIEEHGGQVWAAAHEGPGSTLQFTIPIAGEKR